MRRADIAPASVPHPMVVYLLSLYSESLTYTIAKALTYSGHSVVVWVADVERDRASRWSLSARIAKIPGARVVADAAAVPPKQIDWLVVHGHPQLFGHRGVLDLLAASAKHITAITAGDRSRTLRKALELQWRERQWFGRWFGKVRSIAYKDGPHRIDWLGLFRPRRVVGFDPHSMFLQDDSLFRALHATDWQVRAPRPIRVNFVGSRDPAARSRILDSIAPLCTDAARAPAGQRLVWHVYSDDKPAALPPTEFLRILTDSDFTLAPLGYSLVTHRPIEALLRGSIPVLHASELDLYDLGLADGINCIAVGPDSWPAAIERILCMSDAEVLRMRAHARDMIERQLAYAPLARGISARLGLEPATAGHG